MKVNFLPGKTFEEEACEKLNTCAKCVMLCDPTGQVKSIIFV